MAKRKVMRKRTDGGRNVIALCNPKEVWSPRMKDDAVNDIEKKIHAYFIDYEGKEVDIVVTTESDIKNLVTDPGVSPRNLLLELPDC